MAKRKRLSPAEATALQPSATAAPETKSIPSHPFGVEPKAPRRAPIAQVAGDAATQAALEEVADELRTAKTSGRMVLELPLFAVDETYLVRDRIQPDTDELEELMASLTARGQQTPIEVVETGQGRYGLISGWRRLTALRQLEGRGGAGTIQALLRQPQDASDAYLAMVEENEIRVGLSYYERARIVVRAAEQGAYRNQAEALKGLFGNVSRAKRSKIGSFIRLYTVLDARLQFPAAISERLGLALVKAFEADPGQGEKLRERMRKSVARTAADEMARLERFLTESGKKQGLTKEKTPVIGKASGFDPLSLGHPTEMMPGVQLQRGKDHLLLSGPGVDDRFQRDLMNWLISRMIRTAKINQ